MSALIDVPIVVSPDADNHVAALGRRSELEQMLKHTLKTIPDMERVDVTLADPYEPAVQTPSSSSQCRRRNRA